MSIISVNNGDNMEVIWIIVTVYAVYSSISLCFVSPANIATSKCQDEPPPIEHGQLKPYYKLHSSRARYECDDGYTLIESEQPGVKCLFGKWEGTPPTCKDDRCFQRDLKRNEGLIIDDVPTSNSQYLAVRCTDGFTSTFNAPLCLKGDWVENGKPCTKISQCGPPNAPENGFVQVIGDKPSVGSKAIYSCDAGRILVGSNTSICLETEKWNSPTPKCLDSCSVLNISHGRIGRYERTPDDLILRFVQLPVGTKVENGEDLYLQCDNKYDALGKSSTEEHITCNNGEWSDFPQCKPASCSTKPPETGYSMIQSIDWHHGGVVEYRCLRFYNKTQVENITCDFGSWIGSLPVCSDTRCYVNVFYFPGVLTGKKVIFFSGQTFTPICKRSHSEAKTNSKLRCESGSWIGHLPPCSAASCQAGPPPIEHGIYKPYSKFHNSMVSYVCDVGFVLKERGPKMQCVFGKWKGFPPTCIAGGCEAEPPPIDNGRHKPYSKSSNSTVSYECDEGFAIKEESPSKIQCVDGKWEGIPPTCTAASCEAEPPTIENGRYKPYFKSHNSTVTYECDEGFTFKEGPSKMQCVFGKWEGIQPTCAAASCQADPPFVKYGRYKMDSVFHGSIVNYECNVGFVIKEKRPSKIQCVYGKWEGIPPTCTAASCEAEPPTIENGRYKPYSKSHNSVVTYECDEGFTINEEGPSKMLCIFGKWEGTQPTCSAASCQADPPFVENGTYKFDSLSHGSIVTYECNVGFVIKEERPSKIQCAYGKWEGIPPTCVTADFCYVPKVTNGKIGRYEWRFFIPNFTELSVGTRVSNDGVVTLHCDKKYQVVGTYSLTERSKCNDGKWDYFPACEPASCRDEPPPIKNGVYNPYYETHNSIVTYECDKGFAPSGPTILQCLYGRWEGITPNCTLILCFVPEVPHGKIGQYATRFNLPPIFKKISVGKGVLDGHIVDLVCENKYEVMGKPNTSFPIMCNNGFWSDLLQCEPASCRGKPPTIAHGRYKSHAKSHNSMVTYECSKGFVLQQQEKESSKMRCVYGKWEGTPPTCTGMPNCRIEELFSDLPEDVMVENEAPTVTYNSTVRLECGENFVLHGSEIVRCGADGEWKIPKFECVKGCVLPKSIDSSMIIDPEKNLYTIGESVDLYCPPGKILSSDVVRLMCLKGRWSESSIPHCKVQER